MPNDGIKISLEADTRPLDAALGKIERSLNGLSDRLGTGFRFLDVRISQFRTEFAAFENQTEKSEDAISRAMESLGEFLDNGPLVGAGSVLGDLAEGAVRLRGELNRLAEREPLDLFAEFSDLESQISVMRDAAEAGLAGVGTSGDIARLVAR